jgi:riboflavin synthase alpha subunit
MRHLQNLAAAAILLAAAITSPGCQPKAPLAPPPQAPARTAAPKATATTQGLALEAPTELARYIARTGSVTVDGVSLTVNAVEGTAFEINIIPHTRSVTTLGRLAPGSRVNLEVDLVARYLERLAQGA